MVNQTYADEVGHISIHDGVVRLDLVTFVPSMEEDGAMTPVFKKRIIMSLPALLRTHAGLKDVMQELESQGAIVMQPEQGRAKRENAKDLKIIKGPNVEKAAKKGASPNFPGVKNP
jgi:hypothetical protein